MGMILIMVLTSVKELNDDKMQPKAKSGVLNLSSIMFKEGRAIALSGEWDFYWNELLSPAQITSKQNESAQISVPGTWVDISINSAKGDNIKLPKHGYGTYHLEVSLDKEYDDLALLLPRIGSASKIFVNDTLLVDAGVVATSKVDTKMAYSEGVYNLALPSDSFSITMQVANFDSYWGGLWEPLRLGFTKTLHERQYRKTVQVVFFAGIFFTVCVFNLIQFSLRPTSIQPFLIALTSFAFCVREVEASGILGVSQVLDISVSAGIKISYLTFYAVVTPIVLYFYLNFKQDFKRGLVYLICAVSLIMSLFVVLTTPDIFTNSVFGFQIFSLSVLLYVMYGMLQALLNKRKNAPILFLGTLCLSGLLLHDLLIGLGLLNSIQLASFGLVAFIMCQNYTTYLYFINAGQENKALNIMLASQNKSLESLSGSLEKQIDERTKELENANLQLSKLVNEDPLTGLLNRRGIMTYLQQQEALFKSEDIPFCILLVDFDNFKQLNDSLGHDIGDQVLVAGGSIMQNIIKDIGVAGRWGGEEFLLVAGNVEITEAYEIAEKLRLSVAKNLSEQIKTDISITVGVSQFYAIDGIHGCLKRADEAMYQGKREGRDTVIKDSYKSMTRQAPRPPPR